MNAEKYIPRFKRLYKERIIPEFIKIFKLKNPFQVPKIEKVVINVGVSDAKENIKSLEICQQEIAAITGQMPQIRRAKKSIAGFKLKAQTPIGVRVTLRNDRMYEFIDKLLNCALPRIRDFRGLSTNSFDNDGNYNIGLSEQYIFPEVDLDKSDKPRGMNISIVIKNPDKKQRKTKSKTLLEMFGFPFRKGGDV